MTHHASPTGLRPAAVHAPARGRAPLASRRRRPRDRRAGHPAVPVDPCSPTVVAGQRPRRRPTPRRCCELVRPPAFFAPARRQDTKIGFGEAYMAGDWTAGDGTDLADLLTPFAERLTDRSCPRRCSGCARVVDAPHARSTSSNTAARARGATSSAHYDLSNELFAAFLDETMTYSLGAGSTTAPLRRVASRRRSCARSTRSSTWPSVGAGHARARDRHRLGHARDPGRPSAARTVTTVTLSAEQPALARRAGRRRPGCADRVDIRLQDYREVERRVRRDRRVEMIEAVGEALLADVLRAPSTGCSHPAARSAIQAITMPHDRLLATRALLRLDPEVHLPRRPHPVAARRSSETLRRAHLAARSPAPRPRPALRRDAARCGGRAFLANWPARSPGWASTRRSAGCGSSTSPTARPASAAGYLGVEPAAD